MSIVISGSKPLIVSLETDMNKKMGGVTSRSETFKQLVFQWGESES